MGSIINEFKKNYKTINIIVLCISIYLLIFSPLISILLEKISPALTKCPYLLMTGKPCPLCGGTRFLKHINNAFNDISYLFNKFGLIILIMILEVFFRIILLIKKEKRDIVIKADIFIHLILLSCYLVYSIFFILN